MAGPSFLTPKSVHPSRPVKRFTLAEANRTLPLVRRIVEDIVKMHEQVVSVQAALVAAPAKNQTKIQDDLEKAVEQLQAYVDELRTIGVDLKDYQMGLVDFRGRHQGRDVCLCWRLGEETVGYWHDMHTGFAGRQPVSILQESE